MKLKKFMKILIVFGTFMMNAIQNSRFSIKSTKFNWNFNLTSIENLIRSPDIPEIPKINKMKVENEVFVINFKNFVKKKSFKELKVREKSIFA